MLAQSSHGNFGAIFSDPDAMLLWRKSFCCCRMSFLINVNPSRFTIFLSRESPNLWVLVHWHLVCAVLTVSLKCSEPYFLPFHTDCPDTLLPLFLRLLFHLCTSLFLNGFLGVSVCSGSTCLLDSSFPLFTSLLNWEINIGSLVSLASEQFW